MTPAMLRDAEKQKEEGNEVSVGVLPDLDPEPQYYASLWSTLRASTPGDQPVAIMSIALLVGADGMHQVLPLIQLMDRVYFGWQRDRREAEKKRAARKAKAKQSSRGGRR